MFWSILSQVRRLARRVLRSSPPEPVTVQIVGDGLIRVTIPLADYVPVAGDPAECRPGLFTDTVTAAEARVWAGDGTDPIAGLLRTAADHVERHGEQVSL